MNETGRETLLWKACSEQIRLQVGRFGGLDTKGGIILGFVAAALGGILSQLIRAASERPEWFANWSRLRGISFVLGVSLTLGMIFLLLAACFAVCVLWPRNISMGSDLDWVRAEMESALQEQRDSGDSVKKFEAPYAEELAMLQSHMGWTVLRLCGRCRHLPCAFRRTHCCGRRSQFKTTIPRAASRAITIVPEPSSI